MNFLFLRGQVPQDRDPSEIVFNTIEECDDMWTHLAFEMSKQFNHSELWYWGGTRKKVFSNTFIERWIPSFQTYRSEFIPDVIMCRGGFDEYHDILKRFPNAIKIYYGAGKRFLPQNGFLDYHIILQDSPEQLQISKDKFPKSINTLFIKPAVENIFFHSSIMLEKQFDVCFPASGKRLDKGISFVFSSIPTDLKLLNLGYRNDKIRYPFNVIQKRVIRSKLFNEYQKCKVGIICSNSKSDSCPRVLPEMLASNIPVIILNTTHCWRERYIVSGITGELATESNFWSTVNRVLENRHQYKPRAYYNENLSLKIASDFLLKVINEISV